MSDDESIGPSGWFGVPHQDTDSAEKFKGSRPAGGAADIIGRESDVPARPRAESMYLLAQAPAAGNVETPDVGSVVFLFVFVLSIISIVFVPIILYNLTLAKALARCQPENRTLEPNAVWLSLIPLFNAYWHFVVVSRVASSLRNEYRSRGMDDRGDFGRNVGLAYLLLPLGGILPCVNLLFGLAAVVCFIWHWVDVASYSRALVDGDGRWEHFDYDDDGSGWS